MTKFPLILSGLALLTAMAASAVSAGESSVTKEKWGNLPNTNEEVFKYTLTNDNGMSVVVSNYGALITSINVPDKDGKFADVVLGFDTVEPYMDPDGPHFGAVVGRYGNRIKEGKFTIDGQEYVLTPNEKGIQTLHGGKYGFDKKMWTVEEFSAINCPNGMTEDQIAAVVGVKLLLTSPDGEEGFPGKLNAAVYYLLCRKINALVVIYEAVTDKPTHVNLTQHSYFNLKGHDQGDIQDQELQLFADYMTPVDANLITSGDLRDVTGTPFDFRQPKLVGKEIGQTDDEQIKLGNGYDHNWVLQCTPISEAMPNFHAAAVLRDPASGRKLEVLTTEPGVQFYAGNFLDGTLTGKGGCKYPFRGGLCLETQHYPDSPNKVSFPSTQLNPGEKYSTATIFRFSAE